MLPKEVIDEYGKRRFHTLLKEGRLPHIVYAGVIDFFGDAKTMECSKCGVPVFVRPWLHELIIAHNLRVECICCANPMDLKGQLTMDFAKIEEMADIPQEENFEEHLTQALLLVKALRLEALIRKLHPSAVRVALKYALLIDTYLAKQHGLTTQEDEKLNQMAEKLFNQTPKGEKQK